MVMIVVFNHYVFDYDLALIYRLIEGGNESFAFRVIAPRAMHSTQRFSKKYLLSKLMN